MSSTPPITSAQDPVPMSSKLPSDVKIMEFARHRARELASLTACIEDPGGGGNKRIFQQLPRHMRRRAMSHSIKRVPRRLQEIQKRELEKFAKKPSKRPSRKHRRRPSQLLQAYNRRQRSFIWLETHIWHAKRFKMAQRWGYKIPLHPNDKSIRACYRSATQAVLLQDLSYYCCIELRGLRNGLLEVLGKLTDSDCGLTFSAKMCSTGCREGSTLIHRRDRYPYEAICPVTFLWRHVPEQAECDESILWMWVHPSSFQELLDELIGSFGLKRTENPENREQSCGRKQLEKLAPKQLQSAPIYGGETATLTVLKDALVRFRLLGQLSTAVLTATLKVTELPDTSPAPWWAKSEATHSEQSKLWQELRRYPFAARVPPGSVVGLVVRDPREALPVTRNKILPKIPDCVEGPGPLAPSPLVSFSSIWDRTVRDEVSFNKMPDEAMNKLRSQHLVPGTPLDRGDEGSRIPVLLIQQPGNNDAPDSQPIGIGWDIILPAGWAMAFWIPFVYRCARVGGYREHESICRELQQPHFPEDYPDTTACREAEKRQSLELVTKYFRYPPDKRPNFVKLGVSSPYSFPWQQLVSEWSEHLPPSKFLPKVHPGASVAKEFFVLRNKRVLRLLQACRTASSRQKRHCRHFKDTVQFAEVNWGDVLRPEFWSFLVAVRLRVKLRGGISQFSMVCRPSDKDLEMVDRDSDYSGPCEPHHKDYLKELRKEASKNGRKIKRKKSGETQLDEEMRAKLSQSTDDEDHFRKLYIPSAAGLETCNRPVLGYAKSGGFSYSRGCSIGFAFLAFPAVFQLLKSASEQRREPLLLVRSTHSFQYHFANFDIA